MMRFRRVCNGGHRQAIARSALAICLVTAITPFALFAPCAMHAPCAMGDEPQTPSMQVVRAGGMTFRFATAEQGRKLLTQQDTFVRNLSPFDRQARMRAESDPGPPAFLEFVGAQTIEWPEDAKESIRRAVEALDEPLSRFELPFDGPVLFIHTNGREESGAAYTRGSAIILPSGKTGTLDHPSPRLIAHELFHVLSRSNPAWHDRLYSIIGFERVGEVKLPESVSARRITNPDAPEIQHAIRIQESEGRQVLVTPSLLAKTPFHPDRPSIFSYLDFKLMEIQRQKSGDWVPAMVDGQPVFHAPSHPDFHRQIGRNTGYIIHPEEILADNFALLVTGGEVKDQWLLDAMREVLSPRQGDAD